MPKEIILLDGCTRAGGAAYGYYLAAKALGYKIKIYGVDIEDIKTHPPIKEYRFLQADFVTFLKENHKEFTHFHASPPCQNFTPSTILARNNGKIYLDILQPVQQVFNRLKKPTIIENVPQAPIRPDLVLRGDMFGLTILKKRHFEFNNFFMMQPGVPVIKGSVKAGDYATVVGNGSLKSKKQNLPYKHTAKAGTSIKDIWRYSSGNFWMNNTKDLSESIPNAYTNYIGLQLFKNL